ncbi:hypothetical protein [Gracilibacillus salinarum]|uniref:hypothetical protein n=1 Tax=Gracilibacillus salinarum TaxID=2932255 RepID=UPI003F70C7C4
MFGKTNFKAPGDYEGKTIWLFNVGTKAGYKFNQSFLDGAIGAIDVGGIRNEEIEMVLYIGWNNGRLDRFTNAYRNDDGKVVIIYFMMARQKQIISNN